MGCHFLLQGIFLTQGLKSRLLHWQACSLPLSHLGSPDGSFLRASWGCPFPLTMTLLSWLEKNDFDDHLDTFCFLTIQVQILQTVKSVIHSSITHVYGDASIFTTSDLWLSGWEDVGKVQPFRTNLQKNVYSLSSDEYVGLPFFLLLLQNSYFDSSITSRFYELFSISLISLISSSWSFLSPIIHQVTCRSLERPEAGWGMVRESWVQIPG